MNLLLKYKHQCIIGVLAIALIASVCLPLMFASSNPVLSQSDLDPCNPSEIAEGSENDYVVVDIKGEVKNPGVYKMKSGSIVQDVINEAGGLKSTAYTKNINLSKAVTNEMVIVIYSKSEMKNQTTTTKVEDVKNDAESNIQNTTTSDNNANLCVCESNSTSSDNSEANTLVNINTASKETLMTVSGIGASKADAIIIYRTDKHFDTIEDIKNVSGIGESLFAKIKDYITV